MPDYYGTLGLKPNARIEDIRKAFHLRAKKYHPDVNPDPGASANFMRVIEAYKVLKDPDKRKKYDLLYADRDQHPIPKKDPLPTYERRRH